MSVQTSKQDGGDGSPVEEIPLIPPPAYNPDWLNEYQLTGHPAGLTPGKTPAITPTGPGPTATIPTITVTSTSVDDIGKEYMKRGTDEDNEDSDEAKMDNKGAHVHDDDEYAHYAHRADSPVAIRRGDEYRPIGDHSWNHKTHKSLEQVPSVHYKPCPMRDPVMAQDSQDSEPDSHHGFSAHDMYFLGDTSVARSVSLPSIPDPIPVFIEPLPPAEIIILANKQKSKDIAQYETTKNWKADETLLENMPKGIISIACHLGLFVWLTVLLFQVRQIQEQVARNNQVKQNNMEFNQNAPLEEISYRILVVSLALLLASYGVIIFEAYSSYTRQYLMKFVTAESATEYIQHQRLKAPHLYWVLNTFKLQPARPTTTMQRGKILKKYSRMVTDENHPNKVKVVFEVPFKKVIDVSGDLKSFRPGVMTRLEVDKSFGFITEESETIYERIKAEFLEKFHNRSKKSKLKEKFDLDEYFPRMTVFDANEGKNWMFKETYFWVATIFLLGWPYRWWFRAATEKKKFTIVKLVEMVYDGGIQ